MITVMMTPQGLWNGPGSSEYAGVIIERSDQLRSKLITNHRKRSYVAALLTSGWISLNYPAQHCVVCLPELQIMLKSPFHQGSRLQGRAMFGKPSSQNLERGDLVRLREKPGSSSSELL